ncbi:hypothetical protein [uncultured Bifidobacterium sp.]|uniref:hypothetical protein n=1 Tax=uncultured Bifidobacterium sp. TaxID=165187 RepID=UPI00259201D2|nr:hypothetical protein [uncultured Bifidobacterium sp.]
MQLPSESAVTLRDDWGVNDLIAYLCRSQRSRIVVLLSARQRQTKPPVDADALKRRLGAKADVVVVPSALTFRLTDEFVRKRSAFDGAARVYPCDDEWLSDRYQPDLIQPKGSSKAMLSAIEQAVDREIERTDERERQRRNEAERRKAFDERQRRAREVRSVGTKHPQASMVTPASEPTPAAGPVATTAQAATSAPWQSSQQSPQQSSRHTKPPKQPATAEIRLELPQNDAGVFIADNADHAATLAGYLCSLQSTMPVVITTRNVGMTASLADTEELARMLRDAAYVVDVLGSEATAELNAYMPKDVQTFGNACRVIPAGSAWITHGEYS